MLREPNSSKGFFAGQKGFEAIKQHGIDGKRLPFMPAVHTPWYSISRTRNVVIISALLFYFAFSEQFNKVGRTLVYSYRLERERSKFLKQLDEEERRLDSRLDKDK